MIVAIIYTIVCGMMIILNYNRHHRLFTPMNIYLVVWPLMIVFYSTKMILYYDLTVETWVVVYLVTFLAFFGYNLGYCIKTNDNICNRGMPRKELSNTILIVSLISMIAIVPNTYFFVRRYGFDFLRKTAQIYYDNISGNAPKIIPYLGAVALVGCVLSGIYFSRYKYNHIILLPIVLSVLSILPSGSRGGLILIVLLFLMPLMLKDKNNNLYKISKKEKNKRCVRMILLICGMIVLLSILTVSRSAQLDPNIYQFMSKKMLAISLSTPALFKVYQYFASPIGVLNAFLKNPDFYFGENTFGPIYNILNKLGTSINYQRYQKFYSIPIDTNVGSWIRELMQDFGFIGMILTIVVFCALVGYYEHKSIKYNNRKDLVISSVLGTILIMSFFVWYVREGTMQVVIITCLVMNLKKTKHKS